LEGVDDLVRFGVICGHDVESCIIIFVEWYDDWVSMPITRVTKMGHNANKKG
jgi:hypothetical protein